METVQKEVIFCGLGNHQVIIEDIIQDLELEPYAFDIRLILMEAVTNAYYHGNLSDCTKPITIRYLLCGGLLNLQVEDSGDGERDLLIPQEISDGELLEDGGRGLYLIRCFSDSVEMIHNTMFISKNVCAH
ncbi:MULTISPECIES: ATP-binding protein [unclassified Paenibacillus]|uniref:ATP-binding protein n=1 Tax=unclassified Paenibacillus TaxID=185978 RepID=UPI002404DF9B|nr:MULTISPECIES: ATP-binding protein [unclassified Paenibacillus]MDF9844862.1 serine/threonine-protein kinase RsbW [Paenibacillus sp. PastF-2]MDF9851463.1 serine/threonine-protein kinase RsbW [Paenibacillus sp. PastM-2]MDF9858007.1 serine/threonine-protein kinase RsbW [Paenibacillus sp. PastF-1]MDH6483275.1 serine/threonine-protein kinase RsbW [Paenibacillus sp. PastH-2]MDH6510685.1 serine/threonine-protein kinase RsbW [Paenibacillus sp. PastM-3]